MSISTEAKWLITFAKKSNKFFETKTFIAGAVVMVFYSIMVVATFSAAD